MLLCLAYLVEMKQEADINAHPPWMYKWRSYDLWFCCTLLSLWNLGSFMMRIFLTGRPISVMFSFRSFIEVFTTYPFIISLFIDNGQYLYGKIGSNMDDLKALTYSFMHSPLFLAKLGFTIANQECVENQNQPTDDGKACRSSQI